MSADRPRFYEWSDVDEYMAELEAERDRLREELAATERSLRAECARLREEKDRLRGFLKRGYVLAYFPTSREDWQTYWQGAPIIWDDERPE